MGSDNSEIQHILLKLDNIQLAFGGIKALDGVSLEVFKGEVLAIIGPNGAGKTCILNCINGFYRPQEGKIYFQEREITRMPSHKIAKLGISRTFQNIELYSGLTVLENLLAGRHIFMNTGFFWGALYFGKGLHDEKKHRKRVEEIIDFLEIEAIRKKIVGTLSYGLRKRVELGRALALEPKLLLLDEPMSGMNLEEKEDIARFILDIHEEFTDTIVFVEHDMGAIMDLSSRVIVLDFGRKIAEEPPEEIKKNSKVIEAYLGEE